MIPVIRMLPGIKQIINSNSYKHCRHWFVRKFGKRDRFTLTRFLRSPTQYDALTGPVLDYIFADGTEKKLKIACLGCSSGSEAYTISSVLTDKFPNLEFTIHASDIDKELIEKAKNRVYVSEEVTINPFITSEFIEATFDIKDALYIVKPEIAEKIIFSYQDVLDVDLASLGAFDIVYAQNLMVNMKPALANTAYRNIYKLLKNKSVIFLDGVDLDLRWKVTKESGLTPLDYNLEQIYLEVKDCLGEWPYWYSGLEPLAHTRKDKVRRYSTIYFKGLNLT